MLLGLLAAPTPARACSCSVGPPEQTTPATDATHPANAGVVLWNLGCSATLDGASATVDGAAATLALAVHDGNHALVTVTPTPTSGQLVELRGCINGDDPCPDPGAPLLAYTAAAADEQAPAAPGALSFTVETGEVDVNCTFTNAVWTVTVDDLPPTSREDPVIYTFAVTPGPGEPPIAVVQHLRIADSDAGFTVELFSASQPFAGDANAVCVRVTTSDMAGNAAPPLELCGEASGESEATPTTGQAGTSSGEDASSGSTGGPAEDEPGGCACATNDTAPRWAPLLVVLGLGVRRRR